MDGSDSECRNRIRTSKRNPVHGSVDGAMRGGQPFDIVCTKQLRDPTDDQSNASARFLRLIAARNQESKEIHKHLLLAQEEKQAADNTLAVAQEAECNAARDAERVWHERDLQAEEIEAQCLELQVLKAKLQLAERKST
ncbi:hypothetical protein B0H14DRAFT_2593608 [Mycena olivaceomarginata]|nr:hypothetical protein B0H14DRAFT_2593608 [Mycena olivaceomarginata]